VGISRHERENRRSPRRGFTPPHNDSLNRPVMRNRRSVLLFINPRFCASAGLKPQIVDFMAKIAYNKDAKMDNYGR